MIRWIPVWVFVGAYLLLCVVGSMMLLWRVEPLAGAFEYYFNKIPVMAEEEKRTFLVLLFGGPCAFAFGYWIIVRALGRVPFAIDFRDTDIGRSAVFANLVFYALLAWGASSLYAAGGFARLHTWSDLPNWVYSRWALFSSLNFFQFVNMYMFLPTAAALVVLAVKPRNALEHLMRWLPTVLTLGVDILLYQKKPALLTLLSSGGALWLSTLLPRSDRLVKHVAVAAVSGVAVVTAYFALFLPPIVMNWADPTRADVPVQIQYQTSYAATALLTRTPEPALHYAIVFPKRHPFYNLDLGQDILGFGSMPDDNHVVWRVMYPNAGGGGAAPFNFVLYSQGGIAVSLIGTAVVGALVALCWLLAVSSRGGINFRSLTGVLLLLFMIHLTIDSLRNSAIVSYGFIWGGLLVFAVYLIETILIRTGIIKRPASVLANRNTMDRRGAANA
jgi:hypothetical protein